jgi:hypothetical protein
MNIRKSILAAGVAAAALGSAPVQAALPGCSSSDVTGVSFISCVGWVEGNLINGSPAGTSAIVSQLASLGFTSDGSWLEKVEVGSGSTIDFSLPLSGYTIVGIHIGNGGFLQSERGQGGGTAFFAFDAGTSLDSFGITRQGLSNAAVFTTTPVPEPETYALMLAGLAAVGVVARRRKTKAG